MHWTQALYIGLLCVALACSWRQPWSALIAAVMVGNLVATMTLAPDPIAVGIADAVSAAILLLGNTRARTVAMLFSVMIPVYVSADWLLWPNYATYAIIDLIAYLQLGIVGGLDRGIGRICRAAARRWRGLADPASQGGHAAFGVAPILAKGEVTHERG